MDNKIKPSILDKYKINRLMNKYDDNFFELLDKAFEKIKKLRENEDYYRYYKSIIKKISLLINELKIEDPFLICQSFIYLLWSGYFSIERNYAYSTNGLIISSHCIGATVMTGKGKCCNNAYMLNDVLDNLNIASLHISCATKRFVKGGHNHSITSFYDGDRIYFCDPTQDGFLYYCDYFKAKEYDDSCKEIIIYKDGLPYTENITKEYFDMFVNEPFREHKTNLKTDNDISLVKEESFDLLNSNICLLEDFYNDVYNDIEMVCKKLVKEK